MIRVDAMQAVGKIGKLQAVLTKLSELPRAVAIEAAPGITRLLQAEYADGKDPYGRAWAPLRPSTLARGRRPPPLTDTAKMRDGTKAMTARSNYAGLRLVVGAVYGYFHQGGTGRMVARRILPQFGLPAAWRTELDRAARACFARAKRAL